MLVPPSKREPMFMRFFATYGSDSDGSLRLVYGTSTMGALQELAVQGVHELNRSFTGFCECPPSDREEQQAVATSLRPRARREGLSAQS